MGFEWNGKNKNVLKFEVEKDDVIVRCNFLLNEDYPLSFNLNLM